MILKTAVFISPYMTSFGRGAVAASNAGVCRVWLPEDSSIPSAVNHESPISILAARQLEQYFNNSLRQFEVDVDISSLSSFSRTALERLMLIPFGSVTTYGRLALELGRPSAARAVGRAMASNPVPLIIPCHRVVAADGRLTGYSGSGGVAMKKWFLLMEGHTFQGDEQLQIYSGY